MSSLLRNSIDSLIQAVQQVWKTSTPEHLGPDPDCVPVLRFLGMNLERVDADKSIPPVSYLTGNTILVKKVSAEIGHNRHLQILQGQDSLENCQWGLQKEGDARVPCFREFPEGCEVLIRHRLPGPHPRIRLAHPSSAPMWHRFDIAST